MRLSGRLRRVSMAVAALGATATVAVGAEAGAATHGTAGTGIRLTSDVSAPGCQLGHGVRHVIQITFDNVHFNRDNPNVPSDLEMMPHLLSFIEGNGTMLSNNHTPLIAHTADDILTTYTGLYGDRAGMPISNDYQSWNTDGTTDSAGSFAYWTDPVYDTASHANAGHDTNPSMVYSSVPPATSPTPVTPNTETPAPWVPFTRAGCNVGEIATANAELENTAVDIPKVFGPNSPEAQQLAADSDPYKDPETADYVGIGVHCAQNNAFCASAKGIKYGQTTPSPTASSDLLPNEPGGYTGFQALFGHRYVAPQLGAGTVSLSHNGYEVTNAKGNLVDLNGNELDGAYLHGYPGFPGYGGINAAQSLAYAADMQESGVAVTDLYMADIHGNAYISGLSACAHAPSALGTGSACYIQQAAYYDAAFAKFFKRLAADGITSKNTLFLFSSDEGDHEAGANVGRSAQPTPANCDGAIVSGLVVTPDVACTYPSGTFGELDADITGLLAGEKGNTTPFSLENDSAPEFYVTGNPSADSSSVRQLERDAATVTASNPYSGNSSETLDNYMADRTEMGILHMVNADPARTPTFAMFAKPDYYLVNGSSSCGTSCVYVNNSYAWNHGDYAAEINNNWFGIVGPGVANLGLDGSPSYQGPNDSGANSGQETVVQQSAANSGTWIDETDIQPTLMYLAGLKDDYTPDGRVISQVLSNGTSRITNSAVVALGTCYKQVNSSVGEFGTWTLEAATAAVDSNTTGDATYLDVDAALSALEHSRDYVVGEIESELYGAEYLGKSVPASAAAAQTAFCNYLLTAAQQLASSPAASTARSVSAAVAVKYAALRAVKA